MLKVWWRISRSVTRNIISPSVVRKSKPLVRSVETEQEDEEQNRRARETHSCRRRWESAQALGEHGPSS